MDSYKPIPNADLAFELVYKIRQDAIATGDYHAYRAARELRDALKAGHR